MQDLTISIVQTIQYWEDIPKNLKHFEQLLEKVEHTDIVVLPEMFNTGFTMNVEANAEGMNGPSIEWLHTQAKRLNAAIAASLIIKDDGRFYNRFVLAEGDGRIQTYDKHHLFSMGGEDKPFTPGEEKTRWEIKGWKLAPQICYDLRFPNWVRNTDGYDVILYTANWPLKRMKHWNTLIRARAIENQCYVAAANRIGSDEAGVDYNGYSQIVDFDGEPIAIEGDREAIVTASLSHKALMKRREIFPVLKDQTS